MKTGQPGGHFDQMMRQTRAHHVSLSAMADQKANMLLTISAIVIPLTVGYLQEEAFRWPAIVLIGFNMLTVLLATYTIMPKIRPKRLANPTGRLFNPLFFGDFEALSYDEYLESMERVMHDPASAYEAQIREVYVMGQYLSKHKYRYLRLSYLSFLCGVFSAAAVWLGTSLGMGAA